MSLPNILIIFADDLGVDTFRINKATKQVTAQVTGLGDSAGPVRLPTFERMLAAGVHFEQAWAHPVCTATRGSLWTGMQAWKTGLGFPTGGDDDLPEQTVTRPPTPIVTLAQALGSTYRRAMFGKWDLGRAKNPVQWGWDFFAGIYSGGLGRVGVQEYGFPPRLGRIAYADLRAGSPTPDKTALSQAVARRLADEYKFNQGYLDNNPDLRYHIWHKDTVTGSGKQEGQSPLERKRLYATEDQVEDAEQWIATQKGQGPWCVALNLIAPHDPFHLPPPGAYNPKTIGNPTNPSVQDMLVAMVESVDYYVGKLLAAIDDVLGQTLIMFFGDNGTQDVDRDTGESIDTVVGDDKGGKSVGAVHVPMMVVDGGLMKGGAPCYLKGAARSVAEPVHVIDVYRTILAIAGIQSTAPTDSISLVPHLTGVDSPKRVYNFSQMYFQHALPPDGSTTPSAGINGSTSDGRYRLTCSALLGGTSPETYLVDEQGNKVSKPVFTYDFSRLDPDPKIIGSFVDVPIPAIARRGDVFEVRDPAFEAKILELYERVLSVERLDSKDTHFPVIRGAPLVAHWRMNEGTGKQLRDHSGHGHHATITSAQWAPDGVRSPQVLAFNGGGAITVGTGPSLAGKVSFTVGAWVKTTAGGVVMQQRNGDFDGEYRLSVAPEGNVRFMVFGDGAHQFPELGTTTKVNDGRWHHITAVRDGDKGLVYIDGDLAAQGTGPVRALKSVISVGIAGDIRDRNNYFSGAMFDLRLYRVALSPGEIALDLVQPLVGHWPLDEGSGTTLRDLAPRASTGTLQGGAAWSDGARGLQFDGKSFVALGKGPSLAGKVSFSISAWVQTTTGGVFMQQRNGGFNGEYRLGVAPEGTVHFMVFGDGADQFPEIGTTTKVNDGKWHHVVAVRDGDKGLIYIDGTSTPAGRAVGAVRNLDANISVAIGADIRDKINYFTGRIREVRLYQAALSTGLIGLLAERRPS